MSSLFSHLTAPSMFLLSNSIDRSIKLFYKTLLFASVSLSQIILVTKSPASCLPVWHHCWWTRALLLLLTVEDRSCLPMQTKLSWGIRIHLQSWSGRNTVIFTFGGRFLRGQGAPYSRHRVEEVQSSEHLESHFDRKLDYWHLMHEMRWHMLHRDRALIQAEILDLVVLNLSGQSTMHKCILLHCGPVKMADMVWIYCRIHYFLFLWTTKQVVMDFN